MLSEVPAPNNIDNALPVNHTRAYSSIFTAYCFKLRQGITYFYFDSQKRIRVCKNCYEKMSPQKQINLQQRNSWHSLGHIDTVKTKCYYCNQNIIHAEKKATHCSTCIEIYLNFTVNVLHGLEVEIEEMNN